MNINPNLEAGLCEEGIVLTTEVSHYEVNEVYPTVFDHDIFLTWPEVNKLYAYLDSLLSARHANQTNR